MRRPARDHVRVVADLLGLVGQVVGIHADAVAADQTGAERQEVPLGPGGFQHFMGVDAEAVEDQRQFVDQGDVDVALGVLDDLGRLGHADAGSLVGADGDDRAVQRIDEVGHLRGGAGGHLGDGFQAVLLVARIDPLGAVTGVEVVVEHQSGLARDDRHADLLGRAGVDGGLVDGDAAGTDRAADGAAGRFQRAQVRALVLVDGGGHGDDEDVAALQRFRVVTEIQQAGGLELFLRHFQGMVVVAAQFLHALAVDVEPQRGETAPEGRGERKADIAKADDGDLDLVERGQ